MRYQGESGVESKSSKATAATKSNKEWDSGVGQRK